MLPRIEILIDVAGQRQGHERCRVRVRMAARRQAD
jgi:hypothetical protein